MSAALEKLAGQIRRQTGISISAGQPKTTRGSTFLPSVMASLVAFLPSVVSKIVEALASHSCHAGRFATG